MSVSLSTQRIFIKKASLIDVSKAVNSYQKGSLVFDLTTADYIYVATEYPFNSLFFELDQVNNVATNMNVETYNGNAWVNAVDVIDDTNGLFQSGKVQFNVEKNKTAWQCIACSENIAELSNTKIYNMYWSRIRFSADILNTTSIKYIGRKFCNDDDLFSFYPDLNNAQFFKAYDISLNKNNWSEQEISASEYIINDLKNRNILFSEMQILDTEIFNIFAVHKSADIIFRGLGGSQIDEMERARKEYYEIKNLKFHKLDYNKSGSLDTCEKYIKQGHLTR